MEKQITITQEQMDDLCFSSYQLLQTMSNIYGPDPAYEMFQKFEEVLGQDVKSNLFLKMLDSSYILGALKFDFINGDCTNAIEMIKSVRSYSVDQNREPFGLKAAKDIIDAARYNGGSKIHFLNHQDRKLFVKELLAHNGRVL